MAGKGDDHDKTVFGGQLPVGSRPASDSPFANAPGQGPVIQQPGYQGAFTPGQPQQPNPFGQAPSGMSPDRTVIGGGSPGWRQSTPSDVGGQQSTPFWGPGGGARREDTWLGQPAAIPASQPQGFGHGPGGGIGRPDGQGAGFFPDIRHQNQPQPSRAATPRIALDDALRVSDLGRASSSNPLLASAASLLILLGRLRTGLVDLQVAPLMEHVTREIDQFERHALAAGVAPHEALVAKYALSGTADDIVQNLPGSDRGSWQQYSMVARFFHKRDSGVGFFQEAEKAMQVPGQFYNLLELMLVCMSLGFEGQYRTLPNGQVELSRIRTAIYETLRRVQPRPDEDIAVMWQPVIMDAGRRFAAISVPVVLGAVTVAVVGFFAVLTTLINRDGAQAAEALRALHRGAPVIAIQRTPGGTYQTETPQLERVREFFADEIADGTVEVEAKGDYIAIRVGNLQLFDSGATTLKKGFKPMGARIAEVLNAEGGPVLVQGFTDNAPLSGRGRFKDNYQLSEARADAVQAVLAESIDTPSRIRIEGKGEDEPVGDNATAEGRAQNRRVEILLACEGTYETATAARLDAAASSQPQPAAAPADEVGQ